MDDLVRWEETSFLTKSQLRKAQREARKLLRVLVNLPATQDLLGPILLSKAEYSDCRVCCGWRHALILTQTGLAIKHDDIGRPPQPVKPASTPISHFTLEFNLERLRELILRLQS